jgi:uncharacterized protein (DUF305 family)
MVRLRLLPILALVCLAWTGVSAQAQSPSPASKGYMDAMSKMDQAMQKDMSGDADVDFASMMIPHHQGASDMAKVLLQHGKDPMLRTMAQKMIEDQGKEIAMLHEWLKKHGK